MKRPIFLLACLAWILGGPASAEQAAEGPGQHAAVRSLADVMAQAPYYEAKGAFRAWIVEKSQDFGVVLIEVLGTIPLHMHPDGNRRMFQLEGEMKMLGGEHELVMKPGDYMYLPRDHHHKVNLEPGQKRALFLLVDNPPTSTANVIWIEPAPALVKNADQLSTALTVADRAEAGHAK